jgi:hypothetical protein
VELLETRIEILQESIQKLVAKIANKEDISQYVPENGDYSINKIIDLLTHDSPARSKSSQFYVSPPAANGQVSPSDDEYDESPSSIESQDEPPNRNLQINTDLSNSTQELSSDLYSAPPTDRPTSYPGSYDYSFGNLSLGPYRTAAAMAAAAMTGEYVSPIGDSPLSVTSSSPTLDGFESDPVSWTTVSPALLSESLPERSGFDFNERPSFGDVGFGPVSSKSSDDLSLSRPGRVGTPPNQVNNVHKAGQQHFHSHHHASGPSSPNPYYIKDPESRRRDRSRSKASSRSPRRSLEDSERRRLANGGGHHPSHLTQSFDVESPELVAEPDTHDTLIKHETVVKEESAEDGYMVPNGLGQIVEIEDLHTNFDELWLGGAAYGDDTVGRIHV